MLIKKNSLGISLIEIMVAIFVVTLVCVGVMHAVLASSTFQTLNYQKSVAVMRVQSMLERLRYSSDQSMVESQYVIWNKINQRALPNGHGSFTCQPVDNTCTVQVVWQHNGPHAFASTAVLPHRIGKYAQPLSKHLYSAKTIVWRQK